MMGDRAGVYLDMGKPGRALESLGAAAGSYQAGVMIKVAKCYEALGEMDAAADTYRCRESHP